MFGFEFHVPTRLVFQNESLDRLGELSSAHGDKALLVTGRSSMQRLGILSKAVDILKDAKMKVHVVEGVKSNPTAASIYGAAKEAAAHRVNVIVGLGGGSVLDAARAISLAATHEGDFWEYRITGTKSVGGIREVTIPVITVPTTGGTGNEISPATVITKGNGKEVFYSPYLFPKAALVDPSLALTVPSELSAQIGIDAFIQGMEAYVSSAATPFSDMFALEAMRLAVDSLKKVYSDSQDIHARARLALAGIVSMFAINQAGVGAVHALSDPLSGRYDIHHGLALSIVLADVMRFNLDSNLDKYAHVAQVLGADLGPLSPRASAEEAVVRASGMLAQLALSRSLADFGISESDIPVFAEEAQNPDMSTNPKKMTTKDIESIYNVLL